MRHLQEVIQHHSHIMPGQGSLTRVGSASISIPHKKTVTFILIIVLVLLVLTGLALAFLLCMWPKKFKTQIGSQEAQTEARPLEDIEMAPLERAVIKK